MLLKSFDIKSDVIMFSALLANIFQIKLMLFFQIGKNVLFSPHLLKES